MRTVIILAIGIYIGRQFCKTFDRSQYRSQVRASILKLLQQTYGAAKLDAERELDKVLAEGK